MENDGKVGVKKFSGKRKVKPKSIAVVNEQCTGCGGSPVCRVYCPVDNCIAVTPADEYPLSRARIDPLKCIGCKRCIARGPQGLYLDGCPWDAIKMIPTPQWEEINYPLPY